MKSTLSMAAAILVSAVMIGCDNNSDEPVTMKTQGDSVSYMFGYQLGGQFAKTKIEVNQEMLMAGYRDGSQEKKALISDSAAMLLSESLQRQLAKTMEEEALKAAIPVRKASEKFLAENKKKEGVITTPSGLQYKVISMGTGKKPSAGSTVTVHYTGKLADGKVFDSSIDRGQPATFNTTQVIPGWQEAILLMPKGSKFQLYIPASLAYGDRGAGNGLIPGGAALIFDVELLDVK